MKLVLILILFLGSIFLPFAQQIPNLPIPICAGTAEVINDSIFFFGGANRWAGTIRYSTVYKFDGVSWSFYDSIPDNNVWGMESVVTGNEIFLFAGWPSGARNVRKYDAVAKNWEYLNQGPNTGPYGICVEYLNDHIYLFSTTGSVQEYDLVNDSWLAKTSNSRPGFSLSSVVYQDEVYLMGFYDSTFYKYNPVADEWTQLADTPFQLSRCAMEVINDKIYCAGGSPQGNVEPLESLLAYDVVSNTWAIDEFEMMNERVWMADIMYNNQFIVLGGLDSTSFAVDIVEEIIPIGPITGYKEQLDQPSEYFLSQNYPNPFNPNTIIKFSVPFSGKVTLTVFNILGENVTTLVNESKAAGSYEVNFNASELPSGTYFYQLRSEKTVETKRMILLK